MPFYSFLNQPNLCIQLFTNSYTANLFKPFLIPVSAVLTSRTSSTTSVTWTRALTLPILMFICPGRIVWTLKRQKRRRKELHTHAHTHTQKHKERKKEWERDRQMDCRTDRQTNSREWGRKGPEIERGGRERRQRWWRVSSTSSSNWIWMSCQPYRITSGQSNSGHKQIHVSKLFSHIYQLSVKSIYKTNHFANMKRTYTNIRHKFSKS